MSKKRTVSVQAVPLSGKLPRAKSVQLQEGDTVADVAKRAGLATDKKVFKLGGRPVAADHVISKRTKKLTVEDAAAEEAETESVGTVSVEERVAGS